jgi:hypothetical protein
VRFKFNSDEREILASMLGHVAKQIRNRHDRRAAERLCRKFQGEDLATELKAHEALLIYNIARKAVELGQGKAAQQTLQTLELVQGTIALKLGENNGTA